MARRQQRAVLVLTLALEPLHQELLEQQVRLERLEHQLQVLLIPVPPPLHPEARELLLEILSSLQPPPEQEMRQALGLPTAPR